ncbi:GAF domain-containing protein [Actinoplanes sp. HUAS TT8]|uniref:GAF domain-containing protein n=1 Tax=Actinoplanes sp. HUAS TT8 TaxID=3447453 RepID=UPI003F51BB0C
MATDSRTDTDRRPASFFGVGCQPAIARLVQVVADSTESPLAIAYLVVGGGLMVLACLGADPLAAGERLSLDESLAGEIVETGLPLIISNVAGVPAWAERDLVRSQDIKAYAGFPVRDDEDGQVVAVLAVAARQPQQWTTRQLRCVDDVAQLLAEVLSCEDGVPSVRKSPVLKNESALADDVDGILAAIGRHIEVVRTSLGGDTPGRTEIDAAREELVRISRAAGRAARLLT